MLIITSISSFIINNICQSTTFCILSDYNLIPLTETTPQFTWYSHVKENEEISQWGRPQSARKGWQIPWTSLSVRRRNLSVRKTQRRIQIQQAIHTASYSQTEKDTDTASYTARRIQKQQATNTASYRYRYSKLQIEKDTDTASCRYSQKDTDRASYRQSKLQIHRPFKQR